MSILSDKSKLLTLMDTGSDLNLIGFQTIKQSDYLSKCPVSKTKTIEMTVANGTKLDINTIITFEF